MMLTIDEMRKFIKENYSKNEEDLSAENMFIEGYMKGTEDTRTDVLKKMKEMNTEDKKDVKN